MPLFFPRRDKKTYKPPAKNIHLKYPVKRTFIKNLSQNMVRELRECFGVEPSEVDGHYQIRYGALAVLDVRIGEDGKSLVVTTESNLDAGDDAGGPGQAEIPGTVSGC